jgi:hypothetical protein
MTAFLRDLLRYAPDSRDNLIAVTLIGLNDNFRRKKRANAKKLGNFTKKYL